MARDLSARFPRGFRWSAATAAFQVEGARAEDGRGRSIWDDFVDSPGQVLDGSTADPACDSYHRIADDVGLLSELGVDRYRFSISWVRVQPDGRGAANPAGLDYYSRLVDALLDAGITPFPTLYHWDLPVSLQADGSQGGSGWLSRDTAERFGEYAAIVAGALGDRVKHWYTLNEPASTTLEGYAIGALAPGETLLFDALPTVHHQLLAHARAWPVLRDHGAEQIGIVNNHTHVRPLHDTEADLQAVAAYDVIHNRIFADPLLTGAYPDLEAFGLPPMPVHDGDLEAIAAPCDFYGVNFYNPTTVTAPAPDNPIGFDLVATPGAPVTGFGEMWPVVPSALADLLIDFRERYGDGLPPIVIGENGASYPEPEHVEGPLEDRERVDYLRGHISAVADAVEAGVRVEEYTVWSLLDNFEWASGYTQRFGLVHVDFDDASRTPKRSFSWYRDLIAAARQSKATS